MGRIRNFLSDCGGASMVEYAFLVTLIAMVVFVAVGAVGTRLDQIYTRASNGVK